MPPTPPSESPPARTSRSAGEIRQWIVRELTASLRADSSSIDSAAPLDSLGIDSLAAIGMTGALAGWLGRDLPATLMWDYDSIDAIAEGLADNSTTAQPVDRPNVIDLQPLGNGRPVFFLPGLGGHPITFAPLATHLGKNYPCYGLSVPGINGDSPPLRSVEEIADALLKSVRLVQPRGPYQLAGYSFGGLLAYEMGRQLTASGEALSVLAIYDAFTPAGRKPRPRWHRAALHAYQLATQPGRLQYIRQRLNRRAEARSAAKADLLAHSLIEAEEKEETTAYSSLVKDVARANRAAAVQYRPGPYPGSVMVFRATHRAPYEIFYKVDPTNGWGALAAGGVTVIDLPGTHLGILDASRARSAADALRPHLERS